MHPDHAPDVALVYDPIADRLREECGVFGVFGTPDAAAHTALGLHALQHRGQEATGIVAHDGERFNVHRDQGHVGDVFSSKTVMDGLAGHAAIGHNRYSTTGAPNPRNVQPLFAELDLGGVALAHNGNLTNALALRHELIGQGCIFQSTTDTEVILHLMARSSGRLVERLIAALKQVIGAYSLVVLTPQKLIGVRDPHGVRPLVLGRLGESYILASETVALDIIGAELVREVEPGEMVIITEDGLESRKPFFPVAPRPCLFEYIYFARPDSIMGGRSVYQVRKGIGRELAAECPADADVVIPVPDSGVPAAMGFAERAGLPFELGIIRNHYVGRTFIEPTNEIRHLGVRLKHNANRSVLEGKRVVLIDDSIVRGTTSVKIVQMVREAGAAEVHMRVASPPIRFPCFYGIDTPDREALLASRMSVEGMAHYIDVDSLGFISLDGVYRALGEPGRDAAHPQFLDHYFTGEYPIRLVDEEAGSRSRQQLTLLREAG
ncbi:amidophosphoribosyltransferase [Roseospira marina]|uniref:Amidophosphoribosyltransferase n=1 Tax=Roseospira marina TaxID=140057 RepID=A0A5M6I5H6_9PROT|nr:amidophosphoribosyltransferase [Roseospira marina]KAA5603480.1 amidophosphoribosyltransferase [Roseospira marina]